MSSQSTDPELQILRAAFWGLGLLGTLLTWGRALADGTVRHLQTALASPDRPLPGSDAARLLATFTGLPPLDYLLRTLVVFFWEALDGSHPATTATAVYFAAQIAPVVVAVYLDGLRRGNGPSLRAPSVWFLVFGAAAIGSSGAAWALAYTAAGVRGSPTVSSAIDGDGLRRASRVEDTRTAKLLLPAVAAGYVVPVVLMGLPVPAVVTAEFRQWAIVGWNTFPLIVFALVVGGKRIWDAVVPLAKEPAVSETASASVGLQHRQQQQQQAHLQVVRWISAVSFTVGFALHVAVVAVSVSAALFPGLFSDVYGPEITPWALLAPPLSLAGGETVGDGIRGFMYWDQVFGYALVQLVFLAQLRNALRFSDYRHVGWKKLAVSSFLLSLIAGPGTAVIAISWVRDEVLFGQPAQKDEQPKRV